MVNIEEKKDEMKELWLRHKDEMTAKEFYLKYLGDYGEVGSSKDWSLFANWVKEWKKEIENKRIDEEVKELTDEEAEEVQTRNRKRTIVMANKLLDKFYADPDKMWKNIDIMEIRRLMKTIEGIDQGRERMRIAKGKLQLDAVKTILPYQRMNVDELAELHKQIGIAINELRKQKQITAGQTEPVGQGDAGVGGS